MKKNLTRFLCLVLAAVILFANAGMIVVHHVCHGGHGVMVSFYEEYLPNVDNGCCCAAETEGGVPGNDPLIHFDRVPCCQEFTTYLKADLFSIPAIQSVKSFSLQLIAFLPVLTLIEEEESTTAAFFIMPEDSSPPPSGRSIVISFHQLKIPAVS